MVSGARMNTPIQVTGDVDAEARPRFAFKIDIDQQARVRHFGLRSAFLL